MDASERCGEARPLQAADVRTRHGDDEGHHENKAVGIKFIACDMAMGVMALEGRSRLTACGSFSII